MTEGEVNLQDWVGRTEAVQDVITATPCAALAATLDHPSERPVASTPLPPLWHWLYFLPLHRQSAIGPDGHAHRGGFMPPVSLPRRMWAGSQFEFHSPIRVGDAVRRVSTIAAISEKAGRTGPLAFVKVRHQVFCNEDARPALTEFHDIVYREPAKPGEAAPPPQAAPRSSSWHRAITPDDVLLFRYSALTFNGHRIHYDRKYVTEVEGYPGLIVHGPLIATLLVDLVRRSAPGAKLRKFEFKAVRPTFDGRLMRVSGRQEGNGVALWAQDHEGWLTMKASAEIE